MLWKCRLPGSKRKFVSPVGVVSPRWYLALNPKFALPVAAGLAGSAPGGELIQPPPVTFVSRPKTTTKVGQVCVSEPPSSS